MPTGDQKEAWLVVVLLFLFTLINFADKAVIGDRSRSDHARTEAESARIQAGRLKLLPTVCILSRHDRLLVNRVQTRWVLLAMGLIWALTQWRHWHYGFPTSCVPCRRRSEQQLSVADAFGRRRTILCRPGDQRTLMPEREP